MGNTMTKRVPVSTGLSPAMAASISLGAVTLAALIGKRSSPTPDHPRTRRWYRQLEKPGFTPPAPVYGVAWTGIQAALTYGGYRLLSEPSSPARDTAVGLWAANQVGVAGWSAVFFGRRAPGWGTVAAAAMAGTAAGYVHAAARVDSKAALTGIPLVAWVGFATLLSEEIWRRNDDEKT